MNKSKKLTNNIRSLVYSTAGMMCFSATAFADLQCDLPVDSAPISGSIVTQGIYGNSWGRDSASAPGTLLGCSVVAPEDLNNAGLGTGSERLFERAYLMRYLTTDAAGRKVPATGILFTPKASSVPSSHQGKSPLIAIASGTQGVNDKCAPSKLVSIGEAFGVNDGTNMYLQNGMTVMVVDYIGLGTVLGADYEVAAPIENGDPADDHPYLEGESSGHVILDGIRAARQVPGAHYASGVELNDTIPLDWPVAISGYSQGGAATLWATLLAPNYAPELPLRASIAGAPPVDLKESLLNIDDSNLEALNGLVLVGAQNATHPSSLNVNFEFSPVGVSLETLVRDECIEDIITQTFSYSGNYQLNKLLVGGDTDLFADPSFQLWMSRNSIVENGIALWTAPATPTLAFHGMYDDVIPHDVGEHLFTDQWGATPGTVAWSGDMNFPRVDLGWQSAPLAVHLTGSTVETNVSSSWLRYTALEWLWDGLFIDEPSRQTPDLALEN